MNQKNFEKRTGKLLARFGIKRGDIVVATKEAGDHTTVAINEEGRLTVFFNPTNEADWAETAAEAALALQDPALVLHMACSREDMTKLQAFGQLVRPLQKAWTFGLLRQAMPMTWEAEVNAVRQGLEVLAGGRPLEVLASDGPFQSMAVADYFGIMAEAGRPVALEAADDPTAVFLCAVADMAKEPPRRDVYLELLLLVNPGFRAEYRPTPGGALPGQCLVFTP